jgi:hypothetical protein
MTRTLSFLNIQQWNMIIKTRTQICKKNSALTKFSFNNIWKHMEKHEMKETRLWYKIVLQIMNVQQTKSD